MFVTTFDQGTGTAGWCWCCDCQRNLAATGMAVWRDLRRGGAVLLGPTVWAVPNLPAVEPLVTRVKGLVEQANGTVLALVARTAAP